jgi:pyruvate/2-oxoglutarate dehydrogenase complex dihydrolipoamide acyltransferase (E2) component
MSEAQPSQTAAPRAILVPREIVNADSVFVVSWAVVEGTLVEAGAALCDIETSKAIETVTADDGGYVRIVAEVGAEVPVGGVLGYLTDRADEPLPSPSPQSAGAAALAASGATAHVSDAAPAAGGQEGRISAKARRKIAELGLDPAAFAGHAFVREQDVVEYARTHAAGGATADGCDQAADAAAQDARGPFVVEPLGVIQRRVAHVMEQSVAAIPAACLERRIDLAPVRARARAIAEETKLVVTEVDLVVEALAKACTDFPHFNAYLAADHTMRVFHHVNVGVAVDVEGDLFVVVVKDAGAKPAAAIAKELRGLQYLAQRRRLSAEHLTGGTITITSMLGRGVHRFEPIPYPQQSAILGIADPLPGDTHAVLTLVFDHRVANGSQAAAFLAAVAAGLES